MVPRGARAVREVGAGLLPERGDAGADKHGFIAVFGGGWVHRSKTGNPRRERLSKRAG